MKARDENVQRYLNSIYDPKTGKYRPTLWRRFVWSLQDQFNKTSFMVMAAVIGTFAGALLVTGWLGYDPNLALFIAFSAAMSVICGIFAVTLTYRRKQAKKLRRRRRPPHGQVTGSLDDYDVDVRPRPRPPDAPDGT